MNTAHLFIFTLTLFIGLNPLISHSSIRPSMHVNEADKIIEGTYIGNYPQKNNKGQIETVHSLKLLRYSGDRPRGNMSIFNFRVIAPGGKWNGVLYQDKDSIVMEKNKHYFLLLKEGHGQYQTLLGQDSVFEILGNKTFLTTGKKRLKARADLFYNAIDKELGGMTKTDQQDLRVYSMSFKQRTKRSPASLSKNSQSERDETYWPIFLLLALGLIANFLLPKNF